MLATKNTNSISYASIFKVVIVILGLAFLYVIRDVVGLLFVAVVVAAALDPFVDYLHKKKIPRAVSILAIYLILFGIVSLMIVSLVPAVSEQAGQLASNLPDYYERIALGFNRLGDGQQNVPATLPQALSGLSSNLAGATSGVFSTITGIFGGLVSLVSFLVIVFYLMVQENGVKYFLQFLVPLKKRAEIMHLIDKIQTKLGFWLRGQLILCLLVGLMVYLLLLIMGVKYALLLGLIAAITEIIPYVGPIIGAVPGIFIAFSDSFTKVLMVALVYLIVQQVENSLLVPKIMQKSVGLNPVVVMVAILVGGSLGGVVGALLAVPVAAIIDVVVEDNFPRYKDILEDTTGENKNEE
ncbi:MAG TPA: AI-2E family transporter [bacterium]|nr:AI-2E family transporter [bacterium]